MKLFNTKVKNSDLISLWDYIDNEGKGYIPQEEFRQSLMDTRWKKIIKKLSFAKSFFVKLASELNKLGKTLRQVCTRDISQSD